MLQTDAAVGQATQPLNCSLVYWLPAPSDAAGIRFASPPNRHTAVRPRPTLAALALIDQPTTCARTDRITASHVELRPAVPDVGEAAIHLVWLFSRHELLVKSCCRFDGHLVKLIPPYVRTQLG